MIMMVFSVLVLVVLLAVTCSAFYVPPTTSRAIKRPLTSRCRVLYVVQQRQPAERGKNENIFQELLRAFLESLPWTLVRFIVSCFYSSSFFFADTFFFLL